MYGCCVLVFTALSIKSMILFDNGGSAMEQLKPIPIGVEFYKEIISKGYYYIDKTLLIRDILSHGSKVTLFTRPRRFGKTLAQSMLCTFFEIPSPSTVNLPLASMNQISL